MSRGVAGDQGCAVPGCDGPRRPDGPFCQVHDRLGLCACGYRHAETFLVGVDERCPRWRARQRFLSEASA